MNFNYLQFNTFNSQNQSKTQSTQLMQSSPMEQSPQNLFQIQHTFKITSVSIQFRKQMGVFNQPCFTKKQQYELNQKLVNFNNIPKDLQDEFIQKCIKI